jgi:hypothetical protein
VPNIAVERRGDLFGAPFSNRLDRLGLAFATHDYPKTQAILLEVLEHRSKIQREPLRRAPTIRVRSCFLYHSLFANRLTVA